MSTDCPYPIGSVIQNHKGEFGVVVRDGKVVAPLTVEQVRHIIDDPTWNPPDGSLGSKVT